MKLNSKQKYVLKLFFTDPISANILWKDIERLLITLGAEISEGRGSRVRVALNDVRAVFHRPHPQNETDKGSVRYINCGDWVEHFSAAECVNGEWSLNYYHSKEEEDTESPNDELFIPDKKQVYKSIVEELSVAAFF